jgi:nucleotidyltransferase/DNA polymerase involved in DNA repair
MLARKIIHIDMDAFYASVEQRDNPQLRGKPVIVAWRGNRSVVCAASYEARKFGVRSAMPAVRAERLCPNAVFLPPDFPRYRAVSLQVREIFKRHTDLIEPLSLDEAYLDVSENKTGLPTATQVARTIREQIRSELGLTASAGVAPNKFLAKIASDWKKPDGLFVIQPEEIDSFLLSLPVDRLPGVGKVTEEKLKLLLEATLHRHSERAIDSNSDLVLDSNSDLTSDSHSALALHCHSERSEEPLRGSATTPLRHSERSRPTLSSRPAPAGRSAREVEESLRRSERVEESLRRSATTALRHSEQSEESLRHSAIAPLRHSEQREESLRRSAITPLRHSEQSEESLFNAPTSSHPPTVADLRKLDLPTLEGRFGRYGVRLYELARGIDNSDVVPDRPTQSISAEDTFEQDVLLAEMEPMIRKLAQHTWTASRKESRIARTVVLKLKTSEFKILTRSHTPTSPPTSCDELTNIALSLRGRVSLSPHQRFRLVGVGLSNFCDPEDRSAQSALFA